MLIFFVKIRKKYLTKQETNLNLGNNIETHGVTVAQVILVHLVGVRIPVSLLF